MDKHSIKKILLGLGLAVGALLPAQAQQNIQFTQYMFNSLSINPAYAGYKEEWFAQTALRNQWVGIDGAPKTGQLSLDGVVDHNKNLGIGVQVTADKLASQTANSIYANLAYRLRLNADDTQRLSFGIGAGLTQYGLDGTMLTPIDDLDNALPLGKIGNFIPDVRIGTYYYNPKWYIGVSLMDLLSGDKSNSLFRWEDGTAANIKRKRHVYLITGMLFNLSEQVKLRPSLLVKEEFKGPTTEDISAMFIFKDKFWIGGSYRTGIDLWDKDYYKNQQDLSQGNALAAIAQFYATERLRIGYSYDYMLNGLRGNQNGSHEITLGLTFGKGFKRIMNPRYF